MVRRTSRGRERPGPDVLERMHEERRSGRAQPLPTRSPGPAARPPARGRCGLPPLPAAVRALIEAGCAAWGMTLDERMFAALDAHARLLLAWTASINLTSVRDPERLAVAHILDSLSLVPLVRGWIGAAPTLADIGSGGGYPGLPLAIVLPASRAVLIESVGKKARFLEVASAAVARALGRRGRARCRSWRWSGAARSRWPVGVADRPPSTWSPCGPWGRWRAWPPWVCRCCAPGACWWPGNTTGGTARSRRRCRPHAPRSPAWVALPRASNASPCPPGVTGLEGHRLVLVRGGPREPPRVKGAAC